MVEVEWWVAEVFRLDSASDSLKSEHVLEITNQQEGKKISFFHRGSSSFLKLKMINQWCIEFFTASKRAYQAASLSKELAITHILKACDKNQQHLAWTMAKWLSVKERIWCLECAGMMDETRNHHKFPFWFLYFFHVIAASKSLDQWMMWVYPWWQGMQHQKAQKVSVLIWKMGTRERTRDVGITWFLTTTEISSLYKVVMANVLANSCLYTTSRYGATLGQNKSIILHHLLREISHSVPAKCSTMFNS